MTVSTAKSNTLSQAGMDNNNKCTWVRPSDWLPMPTVLPTENKIVYLVAIHNSGAESVALGNFAAPIGQGGTTVDWGDGTVEVFYAGTKMEHTYSYASIPDSTLCSRGYKQAIITASGDFSTGSFQLYGSPTGYPSTSIVTKILDMIVSAPNRTFTYSSYKHSFMERFIQLSGTIAPVFFFQDYTALRYLSPLKSNGGLCLFMFNNAVSLEYIPDISFASPVTNAGYMFANMYNLREAPSLDLSSVTTIASLHTNNYRLESVRGYKFGNAVTTTENAFSNCYQLKTIDCEFNLPVCTTTASMFQNNYSMITSPKITTSNTLTSVSAMYSGCFNLQSLGWFNTNFVTNFQNFLVNCSSLVTIPDYFFARATNMNGIFNGCSSVEQLPNTMDISLVTGVGLSTAFFNMASLHEIPDLQIPAAVSTLSNTIPTSASLKKMRMTGMRYSFSIQRNPITAAEIDIILENLGSAGTTQSLDIQSSLGATTNAAQQYTSSITKGSTTINLPITTGISVGMTVLGTGTGSTTASAVSFDDGTDSILLTGHGLPNDTEVSFPTIGSTTGISINRIYYVIAATPNSFQISNSVGGSSIALTNNSTGTMRYKCLVTAVTPNTSVTLSTPIATTTASSSITYRNLSVWKALLKNWTVTG